MELRLPSLEQLDRVYQEDLKAAFPPDELKSLAAIKFQWQEAGTYRPYCLFDDDGMGPVGTAFLWKGGPGWALLDYLSVSPGWRNDGFGTEMLRLLPQVEPGTVIILEIEEPAFAPDPAMAERRIEFYRRNGLYTAPYHAEIYNVYYRIMYLADHPVETEELLQAHRAIYRNGLKPASYEKNVHIPVPDRGEKEK